jgi:hypothetical protein
LPTGLWAARVLHRTGRNRYICDYNYRETIAMSLSEAAPGSNPIHLMR